MNTVILGSHRRLHALLGVAASCCIATVSMADTASLDSAQIVIKDFMFTPMSITVKVGSTVTWSNNDDEPHSVASDTGKFRSGALDTGESFAFKFASPGTYRS